MKPAIRATTTATTTVLFTGVNVVAFTRVKNFGSMPSRPIANRMRVCPYKVTKVTEKMEMTAPADNTMDGQVDPVTSSRIWARPASCPLNLSACWAPTAASATNTYTTMTVINAAISARGMVRCGSFTSSPAVDTASSPMNEKKMTPAAAVTPLAPLRKNGLMLSVLKAEKATAANRASTDNLMATMIALARADSLAPRMSRTAQRATRMIAGRLTTPGFSSHGAALSACGIAGRWMYPRSALRY